MEFLDFFVDGVGVSDRVMGKRLERASISARKIRRKRTSAGTGATRSEGAARETECER